MLAGCHCRMRSGLLTAMLRTPAQRRGGEGGPGAGPRGARIRRAWAARRWQLAKNLSYGDQRLPRDRPGAGHSSRGSLDPRRAGRRHERAGDRGAHRH
ncbi:MAG: hypothetical protein MZU95_17180 [Desulfomicrobium escambiense]|nr:hypothetical protein [Desulfomicrobium escambiense]